LLDRLFRTSSSSMVIPCIFLELSQTIHSYKNTAIPSGHHANNRHHFQRPFSSTAIKNQYLFFKCCQITATVRTQHSFLLATNATVVVKAWDLHEPSHSFT
jgi:hypothetical protein